MLHVSTISEKSGWPGPVDEILPGIHGTAGVDAVEALMLHLAIGERVDRAGGLVREHLATGGKRLRARLALAAGEALGFERSEVVPWAAACEMLHNATLVHDDIEDGDRFRRGHPTLWASNGLAHALNAGDLMLMLPFLALDQLTCDPDVRWRVALCVARAAEQTARGQALEMDLLPALRLDSQSWDVAAEAKSGALLSLCVEGAALLAGLSPASARQSAVAFARIGVLYQLRDDLADCFGDKGRGMPGNDLREGKVSALVVEHIRLHPDEADGLLALLRLPRHETTTEDVTAMIHRFQEGGAHAAVWARLGRIEAEILTNPTLTALPELHALAATFVTMLRGMS